MSRHRVVTGNREVTRLSTTWDQFRLARLTNWPLRIWSVDPVRRCARHREIAERSGPQLIQPPIDGHLNLGERGDRMGAPPIL